MTDDHANTQQQPPTPNPDLKRLDRLVGTWNVAGGAQGQVTYQWMDGGFFLIQHVELEQYGQQTTGIEIIGHEQPFGAEPSQDIESRLYDSLGNTVDYVYKLEGDTLTIWGGEKGSPAYHQGQGRFSQDGNTITGPGCTRVAVATSRPRPGSRVETLLETSEHLADAAQVD